MLFFVKIYLTPNFKILKTYWLIFLSSTQTQDQVKSRLFLGVVVGESTAVLKLLTGKDQTPLVGWITFSQQSKNKFELLACEIQFLIFTRKSNFINHRLLETPIIYY